MAIPFGWLLLAAAASVPAFAQTNSPFVNEVFPALQKAGCENCHSPNGVASPTRLHFPEAGAPRSVIEAFGDSLVELVDRANPGASLLITKPTNRIQHSGGERLPKGSAGALALEKWAMHLARFDDARVAKARQYRAVSRNSAAADAKPVLRRLTHHQYASTVRDLLAEPSDASSQFPPEDFVDGFKNQYQSQQLSPALIEAYGASAERLAANAFRRGDSRKLLPCELRAANGACRDQFIRTFGRRAFRRPLTPGETERYAALFRAEATFVDGAKAVIEAMLQSPAFLFWMETTPRPDWKPYATAARLSYFLWDTMPDDALLDAAAKGELSDSAGAERMARRMLDHPKAKPALDEFVSQWLRFDRALASARERRTFPQFSREFVNASLEEARRFVGDLVWNDRNFMDVYRGSYGFVNADLAAVYQVPAPARDFERVEFPPEQQRAGVLGQALFLTLTSKPEDTAPTGRGLFVREQFLCQQVPPPPPGAAGNLPVLSEAKPVTNRERLAEHTVNKACASCHTLIDPIGFALENFDAIGVRRDKFRILFYPDEHEAKKPSKEVFLDLDTSGQLAGVAESRFNGARELGELLARTRQCQECVVKQAFRYMTGRHDRRSDAAVIERVWERFRDSGFHYREMMAALVKETF